MKTNKPDGFALLRYFGEHPPRNRQEWRAMNKMLDKAEFVFSYEEAANFLASLENDIPDDISLEFQSQV